MSAPTILSGSARNRAPARLLFRLFEGYSAFLFGTDPPDISDTTITLALAGLIGSTVWGTVSAVQTARAHNRSLSSDDVSLGLLPTPDGRLGVGMALRF